MKATIAPPSANSLDHGIEISENDQSAGTRLADKALGVLTPDQLDALRPRADTDADIAQLIATVDAFATQLALVYEGDRAPASLALVEHMSETAWTNARSWHFTRSRSP